MSLFSFGGSGGKKTAKEMGKQAKRDIGRSKRGMERERRQLQREEQKLLQEIKKAAKSGDTTSTKILAKQLVSWMVNPIWLHWLLYFMSFPPRVLAGNPQKKCPISPS